VAGIQNSGEYFKVFGILLGLIIVYTVLAAILYQTIDRQVRIRASLEVS